MEASRKTFSMVMHKATPYIVNIFSGKASFNPLATRPIAGNRRVGMPGKASINDNE